jgi:hypothetical protein
VEGRPAGVTAAEERVMAANKFETRAPSAQNAVDLFQGKWASDLSEVAPKLVSGGSPMFRADERPRLAGRALGNSDGRFDGMSVLELGPLEGAHSFQLQLLGAGRVVAIESNTEAFLKCLVVKEVARLDRVQFLLGDFNAYLEAAPPRFDLVFCSGVLYHQPDPANLIRLMSLVADRCFVWTHYYSDDFPGLNRRRRPVERFGHAVTYYEADYGDMDYERFWGGNQPSACWMPKDDILQLLRGVGFREVTVLRDEPAMPNGPAMSVAAAK